MSQSKTLSEWIKEKYNTELPIKKQTDGSLEFPHLIYNTGNVKYQNVEIQLIRYLTEYLNLKIMFVNNCIKNIDEKIIDKVTVSVKSLDDDQGSFLILHFDITEFFS